MLLTSEHFVLDLLEDVLTKKLVSLADVLMKKLVSLAVVA